MYEDTGRERESCHRSELVEHGPLRRGARRGRVEMLVRCGARIAPWYTLVPEGSGSTGKEGEQLIK